MHSLRSRFRGFLQAQIAAQALRWRLWAPVALGGGCAVYFALKPEPAVAPLILFAVATTAAWLGARRFNLARIWTLPLMLLACFALGLAVAKLRTDAVAAPIAPALSEPTVVEGLSLIHISSPRD